MTSQERGTRGPAGHITAVGEEDTRDGLEGRQRPAGRVEGLGTGDKLGGRGLCWAQRTPDSEQVDGQMDRLCQGLSAGMRHKEPASGRGCRLRVRERKLGVQQAS